VRWPGSLERVSWCPWDEAIEEKGFLTWDLERRAARFHPIPGRAVVLLAPIRVPSGQPDRLRRRVREVTDEVPGGIDGKIARLRVHGAEPEDLRGLAEELLPALRARALYLSVGLDHASPLPATSGVELRIRLAEVLVDEGLVSTEAAACAEALLSEAPAGVGAP